MTVPALDTSPVHRLNVRVADLSDFQHRYEQAVPLLPATEVDAMVERGASWTEMLDYIDSVAANEFLIYWRSDIRRVMRLAGDQTRCFAVRKHVTAHDYVVPARDQARSVGPADLHPDLRQAGRLLPGHSYRPRISVDADRLSRGTHPLRQHPQHRARAASHIGHPGARPDARGRPLRGLVVRGDSRHHAVAQQLLLTQRQTVAGSPGVAAALHGGNVPGPVPACTCGTAGS